MDFKIKKIGLTLSLTLFFLGCDTGEKESLTKCEREADSIVLAATNTENVEGVFKKLSNYAPSCGDSEKISFDVLMIYKYRGSQADVSYLSRKLIEEAKRGVFDQSGLFETLSYEQKYQVLLINGGMELQSYVGGLKKLEKKYPGTPAVDGMIGAAYQTKEKYAESISYLNKAYKKSAKSGMWLYSLEMLIGLIESSFQLDDYKGVSVYSSALYDESKEVFYSAPDIAYMSLYANNVVGNNSFVKAIVDESDISDEQLSALGIEIQNPNSVQEP